MLLNGATFEQGAFGLSLSSIDGVDGRSHFVVENWENGDFAPPGLGSLVGDYEYRLTLRDANNAGFDVVSRFSVVPEPGALTHLGLTAALLVGPVHRGRRGLLRK